MKLFFPVVLILTLFGCGSSPSGSVYLKTKSWGEEYDVVGVVSGLWEYDEEQNLKRLKKFLPDSGEEDLKVLAKRYQVQVIVSKWLFTEISSEVAILPEGWSYTASENASQDNVVQSGDLVVLSGQRGRLVDFVKSIQRRCSEPKRENERQAWSIGCFEVQKFNKGGYGGKR